MKSNIPKHGLRPDVRKDWTFADKHLPVISHILLNNAIRIVKVKVASSKKDLKQATDLVLIVDGGEVAVRVRENKYLSRFHDFTLRSRRSSGAKTELYKIRKGWCRWYFYCWSDDKFGLADWWLIDLDLLRKSGLLDDTKKHERANPDRKTWFVYYSSFELSKCITSRARLPFGRKDLAKQLTTQGQSIYEIGNELKVPPAMVTMWLREKQAITWQDIFEKQHKSGALTPKLARLTWQVMKSNLISVNNDDVQAGMKFLENIMEKSQ